MTAKVTVNLKASSPEEAQRILNDLLDSLVAHDIVTEFSFEIETDRGIVTERCILSQGRVIA